MLSNVFIITQKSKLFFHQKKINLSRSTDRSFTRRHRRIDKPESEVSTHTVKKEGGLDFAPEELELKLQPYFFILGTYDPTLFFYKGSLSSDPTFS